MFECKDFEALDVAAPFIGAFVNLATGKEQAYPTTQVPMMFSELEKSLRRKDSKDIVSE